MRPAGALRGASLHATLSVEGRVCSAQPLDGSGVGSTSGLAVVADTERALADAVAWMPGRVLVMGGQVLRRPVIDSMLTNSSIDAFAAIVVLADDDAELGHLAEAVLSIPIVRVAGAVDQERIRRAVRITIVVDTRPAVSTPAPGPRHDRRRRVAIPPPRGVPGTIDLRHSRT